LLFSLYIDNHGNKSKSILILQRAERIPKQIQDLLFNKLNEQKTYSIITPAGISQKAIARKEDALLSFVLLLKSPYVGGTIHNYGKRLGELARFADTTKKTVKKYISLLTEKGLANINYGTLFLRSKKIICEYFGIEYYYHLKYQYKYENYKDLKNQLRTYAANDNLQKQQSVINHRLIDSLRNHSKSATKSVK
jgi:hypothetical protein